MMKCNPSIPNGIARYTLIVWGDGGGLQNSEFLLVLSSSSVLGREGMQNQALSASRGLARGG